MRKLIGQKKLKCPKKYSLAKFHNIRKIFQMLDTNGDMVINYKDLEVICEQYYEDELVEIRDKILKSFESDQKKTKQMYDDTHYFISDTSEKYFERNKERRLKKFQQEKCKSIKLENEFAVIELEAKGKRKRAELENYIELIEGFDKRGKAYKLAEQIRKDDKYKRSIDFTQFFKFYKDKDLTNINKVMTKAFDGKVSEDNLSLVPKEDLIDMEDEEVDLDVSVDDLENEESDDDKLHEDNVEEDKEEKASDEKEESAQFEKL